MMGPGVEGWVAVLGAGVWSGLEMLDRLISGPGGFRVFGVVLILTPVVAVEWGSAILPDTR